MVSMAFSVNLGPCSACQTNPADISLGARACSNERCGKTFNQVCSACVAKPCPKCRKGKLEERDKIFPHSLFRAIARDDAAVVARLLEGRKEKIDDLKDKDGETALSIAACQKPASRGYEICKKLIELSASPRAKSDRTGRTPLINAVFCRGFSKKIACLLVKSIDDQDVDGRTALMHAVRGAGLFGSEQGNASIVDALLSLGADQSIRDKQGRTALDHAKSDAIKDRLNQASKKRP
jgi:ankyrin repeat protein